MLTSLGTKSPEPAFTFEWEHLVSVKHVIFSTIDYLFPVFGLGTLIFNGLEIAMHATMNNKNCVDDIVIAHPILQVPL